MSIIIRRMITALACYSNTHRLRCPSPYAPDRWMPTSEMTGNLKMMRWLWFAVNCEICQQETGIWKQSQEKMAYSSYTSTLSWYTDGFCPLICCRTPNQDQDSLLVKRRNDNHSPGPVIRELVPSSHQRSELSNTILCIFSRWDQRIGEGIPIPDSLGEEATFINICISNGSLKCHIVLISTTPSFGERSSVGILALPLRPLYSNISLLSFLLFLRDSHFNCPRMPVILPVS